MKVFLGGTTCDTDWRQRVISNITMAYFNPVSDSWTPKNRHYEIIQRQVCDYVLYVITPKMHGVYSIAEVIDDSNKRPEKTIFCYLKTDEFYGFDEGECLSLDMVGEMVERNGGHFIKELNDVIAFLNEKEAESEALMVTEMSKPLDETLGADVIV